MCIRDRYLPVVSRLTARTGISLSRLLMPGSAAIIMGGSLTMVGNSPLILLNDLLVSANANTVSYTHLDVYKRQVLAFAA